MEPASRGDRGTNFKTTSLYARWEFPALRERHQKIASLMRELEDIITNESPIGPRIIEAGDRDLRDGGKDALGQVIFGSLFAGLGGPIT